MKPISRPGWTGVRLYSGPGRPMDGEDKPGEGLLGMTSCVCEHYPGLGDWVEVGSRRVWVCSVATCDRVMKTFSGIQPSNQYDEFD